MSLFVKICGITTEEAVTACVEAGVDAVGFVFARSPRRVTPATAASLAAALPEEVLRVAVFRRPEPGELEMALREFPADLVQADHEVIPSIAARAVLPVYREGSLATPAHGSLFLYEGASSGVGMEVDRARAAGLARRGSMILAGGLDPQNVFDVIETVQPHGVDVSSGVESRPGIKDPGRIREFVAAAHSAAERLVRT